MKRPASLYLVATWHAITLFPVVRVVARLATIDPANGTVTPFWVPPLTLLVFGSLIWQVIGLLRMRAFHRWIAVTAHLYFTAVSTWNYLHMLAAEPQSPVLTTAAWLGMSIFNVGLVWFLSRRSFRDIAAQYVAERVVTPMS